jgi:hypothetical protein
MGENVICLTAYAVEENAEDLAKSLQDTDFVPWSRVQYITKIFEPIASTIKEILFERKIKYEITRNNFFYMSPETALTKFKDIK